MTSKIFDMKFTHVPGLLDCLLFVHSQFHNDMSLPVPFSCMYPIEAYEEEDRKEK